MLDKEAIDFNEGGEENGRENTRRTREQEEKLDTSQTKKPFTEPKLTFIEPKLTKHGDATNVTAQNGFFGDFSPHGQEK